VRKHEQEVPLVILHSQHSLRRKKERKDSTQQDKHATGIGPYASVHPGPRSDPGHSWGPRKAHGGALACPDT